MTKKQFLKKLDMELGVLEEFEIKDIIDEYSDIIEEKIKHGKTEKEAVEEIGNIEELAKEILSAYKINPNYKKGKGDEFTESAKKLGEDFDTLVKKGAQKASEFTQDIAENMRKNNQELTVEFIFEILLKAIVAIILMVVSTIPFMLIRELGKVVLGIMIFPLDAVLGFIFAIIISILYIICCGFIFLAIFKQYFKRGDHTMDQKEKNKKSTVNEIKREDGKNVNSTENKDKKKEDYKKDSSAQLERKVEPRPVSGKTSGSNALSDILLLLARIFVVLMSLPLVFIIMGIGVVLSLIVYLLISGLPIWSILVLTLGGFILSISMLNMIYGIIFQSKKIHIYPFIIGIITVIIGVFMTMNFAFKFDYIDQLPKNDYKVKTEVIEKTLDPTVTNVNLMSANYNVKIDDTLKTNQLKVETKYYSEFVKRVEVEDHYCDEEHTCSEIYINIFSRNGWDQYKNIRKVFIDHFRKYKIYNYNQLFDPTVTVYVNTETKQRAFQ